MVQLWVTGTVVWKRCCEANGTGRSASANNPSEVNSFVGRPMESARAPIIQMVTPPEPCNSHIPFVFLFSVPTSVVAALSIRAGHMQTLIRSFSEGFCITSVKSA